MKATMIHCLRVALEARGECVVDILAKRIKMTRTKTLRSGAPCYEYYYLGFCGSIRTGKTLADSMRLSEQLKAQLLQEGQALLAKAP